MGVYRNDPGLPSLPVPTLEDTCTALRQMMRPLLDDGTYRKACRQLDRFGHGEGPALHKFLLRWQQELGSGRSWLRPLWDDSYLTYRGRLPVWMNYCFQLVPGRWGDRGLPSLIWALARQQLLLGQQKLPPEIFAEGYLSMDTVRTMFYTRIPGTVKDSLVLTSLTAPLTAAVACKGHWFILNLTDGMQLVSPDGLGAALTAIRGMAAEMGEAPGIGSFTTANRAQAAAIRDELLKHPLNRAGLGAIEESAFAVCLDDGDLPEDSFLSAVLFGTPENRWFDKSLQIIAGREREIGLNFEHAGCDAAAWLYLLNLVDSSLLDEPLPAGRTSAPAHIRPLRWYISETAQELLQKAAEEYLRFTGEIQLAEAILPDIGGDRVKAKHFRPDAFVQLLYQMTYHRLTGRLRSVYESVSTRYFYEGRTECARPLTEASAAFVKAFAEGGMAREQLQTRLRAAEQAHSRQLDRAKRAMGPERHLWGLQAMDRMHAGLPGVPPWKETELFSSEGYLTLTHDHLSTSSTAAPYLAYFSIGPVVADGLGIGYGIQPGALHLAISSAPDSGICPREFIRTLAAAAGALFALLD